MDAQTLPPQRTLAGYTLLREAGRGAMSTVYEARDPQGRLVALKVLHAPATLPPDQQKALADRLDREARVMLHLAHPNIIRIFDVGEAQGERFLVMEYLDGITLRQRLDTGPVSLREASRILDQIAEALDAVHAQGVVHRDVKPSNVMLLPDGRVKLMDFGVARQGNDTTITQTGMIVGSPAYMSPEQVRGAENTPASDLWALGILLYEMLAGQSPFAGANVSTVLYRVAHDQPAPIPGVSAEVQQILRRALDKNPARRYASGYALAEAFRSAIQPDARPRRLAPSPQYRRWQAMAIGIPVVLLLGLLVGTVFLTRSRRATMTPHPRLSTITTVVSPGAESSPPSVRIKEITPRPSPTRKPIAKAPAKPRAKRLTAAQIRQRALARKRLVAWQNHLRRLHRRQAAYRHRGTTRRHRTTRRVYYWRPAPSTDRQHLEQLHNFTWSGGYHW